MQKGHIQPLNRIEITNVELQLDTKAIKAMISSGDIGIMIVVLAQVTRDPKWVSAPFNEIARDYRLSTYDGSEYHVPEESRRELLHAFTNLIESRQWEHELALTPMLDDCLLKLMGMAVGDEIGTAYLPKFKADLGLEPELKSTINADITHKELRIAVIGAGLSGLNVADELLEAGIENITLFERMESSGGVWLETVYPECGVDTVPHLYDWSRHPNTDWTRYDVKRDELLGYINHFSSMKLDRMTRYNTEVTKLIFQNDNTWRLESVTKTGQMSVDFFDVVVSAVGTLNIPKYPTIEGLKEFEGEKFHSSRWPEGIDLTGLSVGLIGNGSSGAQVGPPISREARSLTVFQRSPAWIAPRATRGQGEIPQGKRHLLNLIPNYRILHRFIIEWQNGDRVFPALQIDERWDGNGLSVSRANGTMRDGLVAHLEDQLGSRKDLMEKLLPDYPPFAKRLVVDSGYIKMMTRPNVRLVTDPVAKFTPRGIQTENGENFELDVVVLATGFQNTTFLYPIEVRGATGMSIDEVFLDGDARAYLGIAMPGFPNLFSIQGPNSSAGFGGAATFVSECQANLIREILVSMAQTPLDRIEVDAEACEKYNQRVDQGLSKTVWSWEGVGSRYKNSAGRIVSNHAWTLNEFWLMTRHPDWSAFHAR